MKRYNMLLRTLEEGWCENDPLTLSGSRVRSPYQLPCQLSVRRCSGLPGEVVDFAAVGPEVGSFAEAGADGVLFHVVMLVAVVERGAHSAVPLAGLPCPCGFFGSDGEEAFPVAGPGGNGNSGGPRSAEKMNVVWHDNVGAYEPSGDVLPRLDE